MMAPLESGPRNLLEKAILAARLEAEKAAAAALRVLAVAGEAPPGFTPEQRRLRNTLRAKARQLGGSEVAGVTPLGEEVAYVQWHRMLFARFLLENGLLMHPAGAITFEECGDMAAREGEPDAWALAASYASVMLPGIFQQDDPSSQVRFAPEGRTALEGILSQIPPLVFTSDDGLGWVYQFWQTKRKKEVSGSGRKIERLDLAAYSELFTEHYMVRFLLENSLGAWWASRHPGSPLIKEFDYLRWGEDGAPTAGTFPSWPERAAEVTVMDPCCGSGHFLVSAFDLLRQMRMEEEGLSAAAASDAVLRDNLFGLELDPRCVQIAAFNLALAGWKAGGYRPLPALNLACSGIAVSGQLTEWTKLAGSDGDLRHSLEQLYQLFVNAPDLGSLINPTEVPLRERMFAPDFAAVRPVLDRALAKEKAADPVAAVFGQTAAAAARAAGLLAGKHTLVATNVPYLVQNRFSQALVDHIGLHYRVPRANLATAFIDRCLQFCGAGGTVATVATQAWFAQTRYEAFRHHLLVDTQFNFIARLGPGAFETITGEVVNVALTVITAERPVTGMNFSALDAAKGRTASSKASQLIATSMTTLAQGDLARRPGQQITLQVLADGSLLGTFAECPRGIVTGDGPKWIRCFWELAEASNGWRFQQSTLHETLPYGGREHIVDWRTRGRGMLRPGIGNAAYGRTGVAISQMGQLPVTLYDGDLYDNNTAAVVPKNPKNRAALWAFCRSAEFTQAVRVIDSALKVTNDVFLKVPFDLERWQRVAAEIYPKGLPEPYSNDPTQWLFKGAPGETTEPLQVGVARLLGYRWPQQETDRLDRLVDSDGIVPLVPIAGVEPAEPRLRELLAAAYGSEWSSELLDRLLAAAGFGPKGLEAWLRDGFFDQHCKLFQQRPFIWQIWDCLRDGFSVLVNYHKLDTANLDRLIYTHLGTWIAVQRNARDANTPGAEARLVAALKLQDKLKAIQAGEPPHDVYVRWRTLAEQPMGWDPDLDDGVRLNIRPFVEAGVLRGRVNVNWNKDRGTNLDGSERVNDKHFTVEQKTAARGAGR